MGNCAENTAKNLKISRDEQDQYAMLSYKRSAQAYEGGHISEELVPVSVPQKRGQPLFNNLCLKTKLLIFL